MGMGERSMPVYTHFFDCGGVPLDTFCAIPLLLCHVFLHSLPHYTVPYFLDGGTGITLPTELFVRYSWWFLSYAYRSITVLCYTHFTRTTCPSMPTFFHTVIRWCDCYHHLREFCSTRYRLYWLWHCSVAVVLFIAPYYYDYTVFPMTIWCRLFIVINILKYLTFWEHWERRYALIQTIHYYYWMTIYWWCY